MRKIKITADEFGKVLSIYNDIFLKTHFQDVPVHHFSDDFNNKMDKMIKPSSSSPRLKKRAVIIFAVAILIISGFSVNIGATREPILDFIVKPHKECSDIIFFEPEGEVEPNRKFRVGYIPDGLVLDRVGDKPSPEEFMSLYYIGENKKWLSVKRFIFKDCNVSIDTEDAECTELRMDNGCGALVVKKNGDVMIVYVKGKYYYDVCGNIGYDEIKKVAESMD